MEGSAVGMGDSASISAVQLLLRYREACWAVSQMQCSWETGYWAFKLKTGFEMFSCVLKEGWGQIFMNFTLRSETEQWKWWVSALICESEKNIHLLREKSTTRLLNYISLDFPGDVKPKCCVGAGKELHLVWTAFRAICFRPGWVFHWVKIPAIISFHLKLYASIHLKQRKFKNHNVSYSFSASIVVISWIKQSQETYFWVEMKGGMLDIALLGEFLELMLLTGKIWDVWPVGSKPAELWEFQGSLKAFF